MGSNIKPIVEAIAAEILSLAHSIIDDSDIGLRDSALKKDMQVIVSSYSDPIVIETVFNDYVEYIENGRRPMSGKQPPMDKLRDWALARDIPTDNSTLFLISRAIGPNGNRARPILATLEEQIEERWENEWADLIAEEITKELTDNF